MSDTDSGIDGDKETSEVGLILHSDQILQGRKIEGLATEIQDTINLMDACSRILEAHKFLDDSAPLEEKARFFPFHRSEGGTPQPQLSYETILGNYFPFIAYLDRPTQRFKDALRERGMPIEELKKQIAEIRTRVFTEAPDCNYEKVIRAQDLQKGMRVLQRVGDDVFLEENIDPDFRHLKIILQHLRSLLRIYKEIRSGGENFLEELKGILTKYQNAMEKLLKILAGENAGSDLHLAQRVLAADEGYDMTIDAAVAAKRQTLIPQLKRLMLDTQDAIGHAKLLLEEDHSTFRDETRIEDGQWVQEEMEKGWPVIFFPTIQPHLAIPHPHLEAAMSVDGELLNRLQYEIGIIRREVFQLTPYCHLMDIDSTTERSDPESIDDRIIPIIIGKLRRLMVLREEIQNRTQAALKKLQEQVELCKRSIKRVSEMADKQV